MEKSPELNKNDTSLNINKLIYLLDFFEKATQDRKIDKFEFRNLYKNAFEIELNNDQVNFLFYFLEHDLNFRISFKEFLKVASFQFNDEFEFSEKKYAQNIFAHLDVRKTGQISFNEFKNLSKYFLAIYQIVQLNNDGIVICSQKNVADLLFETKEISEFSLQTIFYSLDENSNSSISFNEFEKLIDKNFKINIELFAKNIFIDLDPLQKGYVTFEFLNTIFALDNVSKKYFIENKINNKDFLLLVKQNFNLFIDDESIDVFL